MKVGFCLIAPLLACAAISNWAVAQNVSQLVNRPKVRAQLAAVPDLDSRLAKLEATLSAAKDQASLTATTAQYILAFLKAAKAKPQAFDFDPGQQLPPPSKPPSKITDLISTAGTFADLGQELARAEAMAAAVTAGQDPLAGATGNLSLAYRSDLDGALLPFRIYVPTNYDKSRPWPMIVLLHGKQGDENSLFMQGPELPSMAQEHGYIIASINGRGPFSYYRKDNGAEKDLLDVIAQMERYYAIDKAHIFLAGHSMGAWGTWNLGLEHRDLFAALAPMAGSQPLSRETLETGKKIPILITAGAKDTQQPARDILPMYQKLKDAGYPTKMLIFAQDDHLATFRSSLPELFAWFDTYRK